MKALLSFAVAAPAAEAIRFLQFAEYGRAVGSQDETLTWDPKGAIFRKGDHEKTGLIKVWQRVNQVKWQSVRADYLGYDFRWSQGILVAEFGPYGLTDFDPKWIGFIQTNKGTARFLDRLANIRHHHLPWNSKQREALLRLSPAACDRCIRTLCHNLEVDDLRKRIQIIKLHELFYLPLIRYLPKEWYREELDVTDWEFLCALRGWDSRKPYILDVYKAISPKGNNGYQVVEQVGRSRRETFYLPLTLPEYAKKWLAKKGVSLAA